MKSIFSQILCCLRTYTRSSNLNTVVCTAVMLGFVTIFTPATLAAEMGANNGAPVLDVIKQESTVYLNGAHTNYTVSAVPTERTHKCFCRVRLSSE